MPRAFIEVGSTAAKKRLASFNRKYQTDYDAWTDDPNHGVIGDISVVSSDIMHSFSEESKRDGFANLDDLATIKLSHLPYDIFWNKHKSDYLVFMHHGAKINQALYDLLKVHWKEIHGTKQFLSLYRSKDEFFNDYVSKQYEHDYLHELVAHPNLPVYQSCLKDGQEVAIDKLKFDSLPFDQKIRMFREEINVIAIERWMVNPACKGNYTFPKAYGLALQKTVTSLTKGWASEFICENLELFLKPSKIDVSYAFDVLKIKV